MSIPLTNLGAATSIPTLIEVLSRIVTTLHTLDARYATADFTFMFLIGQLTSLKAALTMLQEWRSTDSHEPHHQLVMDWERSIACCRMLVRMIGDEVDELGAVNEEGGLDAKWKSKLMGKNGGLEETQKKVDRQIEALSLLLTACNCTAISDQKALLEKLSTRKVFTRIRDDTSSLYVQRDSSSFHSRYTDTMSKISKTFEFDSEVFFSRAYEKAFRGFMRETLGGMRREKRHPYAVTPEEARRNQQLDLELRQENQSKRWVFSILLLGDRDSAQIFMKTVKLSSLEKLSDDERRQYCGVVMKNVLRVMQDVVRIIKDDHITLDDDAQAQMEVILREIDTIQAGGNVSIEGGNSLQSILRELDTIRTGASVSVEGIPVEVIARQSLWTAGRNMTKATPQHRVESSKYFVEAIQRIAQPGYLPTNDDLRALDHTILDQDGIQEHKLEISSSTQYRMINATSQPSGRSKWLTQFDNTISVVFFVDLGQHDEEQPESSKSYNYLLDTLYLFDSHVNSEWFSHSCFIILLCNVELFAERLKTTPLSDTFPDFSGGADGVRATKYILWRLDQLNRAKLNLYPHMTTADDSKNLNHVLAATKETILEKTMRDAGLDHVLKRNST